MCKTCALCYIATVKLVPSSDGSVSSQTLHIKSTKLTNSRQTKINRC